MKRLSVLRTLVVGLGMMTALVPTAALDLPAHAPGSICVTPDNYWCWINQIPVGAPCACPSPYGPVSGAAQ